MKRTRVTVTKRRSSFSSRSSKAPNFRNFLSLVVLLVVLVGLFGFLTTKKQQKEQAKKDPAPVVTLMLDPESVNLKKGATQKFTLKMDTHGRTVSAAQIYMSY